MFTRSSRGRWTVAVLVLTGVALAGAAPARAQNTAGPEVGGLDALRREIAELESRHEEDGETIRALRARLEALEGGDAAASPRPSDQDRTGAGGESGKADLDDALDRALAELDGDPSADAAAEETPSDALDRALAEASGGEPSGGDLWSYRMGPATLRAVDLSVDLLFVVGSSTERDSELENLQGGGHDPKRRGFNLSSVELSFAGAVDPYFTGEVHVVYLLTSDNESHFELEEAFLTTMRLPFGLEELGFQLEAGQMLTEFGRVNPRHPHAWEWLDQPVVNTRLFGPDGTRGPGFRLGWMIPVPWFSELHFSMQNARGETMASFLASDEFFEERPIGGRSHVSRDVRSLADFAYAGRWVNSWDVTDEVTMALGGSVLAGPNATGLGTSTLIYGGDLVVKWRPLSTERGWPFVIWQTEVIQRDYDADSFLYEGDDPDDPSDDVFYAAGTLQDWGLYTQVLWGFLRDWAVGLRFEYATGNGQSVGRFDGRSDDPFRDDRTRLAPLVVWDATHFSRVRLQYNFDEAQHLDDQAHSVWMGFEILFGEHPVHEY